MKPFHTPTIEIEYFDVHDIFTVSDNGSESKDDRHNSHLPAQEGRLRETKEYQG